MINLNTKVKAEKSSGVDFSIPVPEGEYTCRVHEIKPWKERTVAKITLSKTGEELTNVKIYNCGVVLEIVEGEYKGRRLFYNLTTHPNMPWIIPNFVYATGKEELTPAELTTECVGRYVKAVVVIEEKTIEKEDKSTGLVEEETKKVNTVKTVKESELNENLVESDEFNV